MLRLERPIRALTRLLLLLAVPTLGACGGGGGRVAPQTASWALPAVNPAYLAYLAAREAGQGVPELQPPRFAPDALVGLRGAASAPPVFAPELCALPAAYDLRTLGRVTPARDSTSACGTCWTASVMGALESILAPFEVRDFSEAHLQLLHGADGAACGEGGNRDAATRYLAAWRGPVDETAFDAMDPMPAGGPAPAVQKHVQNVLYLPDREGPLDNCWIKLALTNIGGVYSTIGRASFSPHLTNDHTYYHPSAGSVHSVTIVGWDDAFDRNRFYCGDPSIADALRVPAGNGAFLVKDNGGPGWLEQGFFYVSYYDGSIGRSMAAYGVEPVDNYARSYQHDPFGPLDYLVLPGQAKTASWQANVFTAEADEWLTAVGFFEPWDNTMDYQVQVHLDPTHGPLASTGPAATAEISLVMAGYFTVKLPQRVRLKKGQRFSIMLRGRDRSGGWPSSIPIERPDAYHTQVQAGPGESFVSADGGSWQDLTGVTIPVAGGGSRTLTDANVCIKAFTRPLLEVVGAIAAQDLGLTWEIANDGSDGIWVEPIARLFEQRGDALRPIGADVGADYVQRGQGTIEDVTDGWIQLAPGERVTALSVGGAAAGADEVAYKLQYLDDATQLVRTSGAWLYVLNVFLKQPLQVTSSDPAPGATLSHPGGHVIRVWFDRAAKAGPDLGAITVTAGSKVYAATAGVAGNQLTISTAPFAINVIGGLEVAVNIPSHAVLSQAGGSPLAAAHAFAFVVYGVN